jgi:hypothetical protein
MQKHVLDICLRLQPLDTEMANTVLIVDDLRIPYMTLLQKYDSLYDRETF